MGIIHLVYRSTFCFQAGSLTGLGLTKAARLVGRGSPSIHPSCVSSAPALSMSYHVQAFVSVGFRNQTQVFMFMQQTCYPLNRLPSPLTHFRVGRCDDVFQPAKTLNWSTPLYRACVPAPVPAPTDAPLRGQRGHTRWEVLGSQLNVSWLRAGCTNLQQ